MMPTWQKKRILSEKKDIDNMKKDIDEIKMPFTSSLTS